MIEIKTQEQLIELAARSVYLLSALRGLQRDFEERRAILTLHKDQDIIPWEIRADEFLKNIEAVEFVSLKELIEQLKQNIKCEI
jgi:hypothetical protein